MVLVRTINIEGEAWSIFTGVPLNPRWSPTGQRFKHLTLESLFMNGIGIEVAQNDGIDENNHNHNRRKVKVKCHPKPPKSKMATNLVAVLNSQIALESLFVD